ncbi:MAG: plasmid pRiA4b ORF-3 family protein [Pseudomonadota bacterium]|nr:plasmid pRiA4b ORF-3 family protein [Pseudomonadota bacterium]
MTTDETNTQIFRAAPHGKKSVFREIEIESSNSLYHLAEAILLAFDFDLDHAFGFYSGETARTLMVQQPKYELFADIGEESDAASVKNTRLDKAFPKAGYAMTLLFDYGDEWLFRVEMLRSGAKAAKVRYPRLVASEGKSPDQYPAEDD